jgi:uridine phosphorylase
MQDDKKMMHLGLRAGQIGSYVFLPGSPERAGLIASLLDGAGEVAYNREFRTFTGYLDGTRVSVTSTGMGGPSMAIAAEELCECGARTLIRVGTCESASPKLRKGELVLPNGAVRLEGVARHYLPEEYPAVPDMAVLAALRDAAGAQSRPFHIAPVITKACFSMQFHTAGRPMGRALAERWEACVAGGALCGEMSCAVLFIVAGCLRLRAGAVLCASCDCGAYSDDAADWSPEWEKSAAETAVDGMRRLIKQDKEMGL